MTLILSIDTSSKNCSVSLSENGVLLETIEDYCESFSHAENLHVFCKKIIKKTNLSFSDIDAYAFSEGPGSYTGLRIGAAAVKGFAFSFDKPVILVSTMKSMANAHKYINTLLCPLVDSRKGEVYLSLYDNNMKTLLEPQPHIISEKSLIVYLQKNKISFFGTGCEKMKKVVNHENANFISEFFPSSKYLIEIAHSNYKKNNFADISNFEPLYLKEFMPTTQKKNII